MHLPRHNPAATQPGRLFIIISLRQRYGEKKAPTLPRCHQQQLQHPRWDLCTSQCEVRLGKKFNPSLKKKPTKPHDLKPGTRKNKVVEKIGWAPPSCYKIFLRPRFTRAEARFLKSLSLQPKTLYRHKSHVRSYCRHENLHPARSLSGQRSPWSPPRSH